MLRPRSVARSQAKSASFLPTDSLPGPLVWRASPPCPRAASQVSQLSQRVRSTQEVVAIRMDVSRNRIIRAELQLTIASVSLAVVTCVAGFLGMNVEIPAWVRASQE